MSLAAKSKLSESEYLQGELTAKIKSAIQANRDDIAEGYALQLEKAKENFVHTKDQLVFADKAYDKALKVKKVFMREKDRKIQEAKEALRASERAEWQSKIADTLEQFEVGGMDQTHDEMITRLNERTAKSEARMEIALDGIDTETMEIEANAEKIRAHSLVEQFKLEMNESSGSINVDEEPVAEESPKKSVGNKEKS
jgi:phage shock protein A